MLFNIKSDETIIFYKQAVDLGIVWLIGISGFHVSLLSRTIKFILKRNKKIGRIVNITIISFYSFLLNFSYGSLRVLFKLIFERFFKKYEIEKYEKIGFIGLLVCMFNPICFSSYGFLLSFSISCGANNVVNLELNNKITTSLFINILSFVITIPFVVIFNHKIAILTFINAFIFSYISSFIFLYLICFAWMPFMSIIHYGIMVASYTIIGNISFINAFIYSQAWTAWQNCLYYICLVALLKGVYLIVINNKI